MKTPEQYFQEQVFDPDTSASQNEISDQEQAFINRYLGEELAGKIPEVGQKAQQAQDLPGPQPRVETQSCTEHQDAVQRKDSDYKSLSEVLRLRGEVQLVSFFNGQQEYALPIETVQEVIKYIQPSRLPTAPPYVEGVINLRSKITPVVDLPGLLRIKTSENTEHRFMIVCRHSGFQIALLVERIATMYRVSDSDIEWNVDGVLGGDSGIVEALIKNRERIISILGIEKLVQYLLG
ncbi:chemotaxis protein CheW [Desulfonatronospira sp.]|uniref:chemotaxis protein CheW n=1 Tax=Desulfonatronospira sp. TaxID=1962951 RepID=UPI0025BD70DC|nr:chemotaxis protein CheW [Desulfonatronospira sp.]